MPKSVPDPVATWAARVRNLQRADRRNPAALAEARRNLAEAKLERAIREAVDAAPPLTTEQRERLASILTGTDLPRRVAETLGADA